MGITELKTSLRNKRKSLRTINAEIEEMEDEITEPSEREKKRMNELKAQRRALKVEIGDLEDDLEDAATGEPDKPDPDKPDPDPDKPDPDKPDPDPAKPDPDKPDPDPAPPETPPVSEHWSRRKVF